MHALSIPLRVISALLLCGALAIGQATRAIRLSSEAEIKATFLVNFAKFVEWPQGNPADPEFTICIAGDDPFGPILERAAEGELIGSSRIKLKRVARWQPPCKVLFVGASETDFENAQRLAGVPAGILTVGEKSGFLREGGMIAFVVEDRKVRFDINFRAAARASVHISSKLLEVARKVEK